MVKNDIVKYDNILNKLSLSKLEEKELELFFALCLVLKEKGTDEVFISITEFKDKFNFGRSKIRFEKYLEVVLNKFLETKVIIKTSNSFEIGNFFRKFKILPDNILYVQVDNDYQFILNNLVKMYTQFSFKEYQSLKSKYAKRIMPKLAQWQGTKKIEFQKDELLEVLGTSENYKKDISNFNKRVLKPLIDELKTVFYNLKVEPIKNTNRTIISYIFTWSDRIKEVEDVKKEVKTLEISKKLKNLLDEAIKNPRLEILEKASTIEYLLKHYSEDIIIQGIRNLLNVATKIKTRKYIVTVLDNIKLKENIKIKVKEETKTNNVIVEDYQPKEKLEITETEYNKILDEEIENYIQEAKKLNQSINLEIIKMSLKLKMNSKYKIKNK